MDHLRFLLTIEAIFTHAEETEALGVRASPQRLGVVATAWDSGLSGCDRNMAGMAATGVHRSKVTFHIHLLSLALSFLYLEI